MWLLHGWAYMSHGRVKTILKHKTLNAERSYVTSLDYRLDCGLGCWIALCLLWKMWCRKSVTPWHFQFSPELLHGSLVPRLHCMFYWHTHDYLLLTTPKYTQAGKDPHALRHRKFTTYKSSGEKYFDCLVVILHRSLAVPSFHLDMIAATWLRKKKYAIVERWVKLPL